MFKIFLCCKLFQVEGFIAWKKINENSDGVNLIDRPSKMIIENYLIKNWSEKSIYMRDEKNYVKTK